MLGEVGVAELDAMPQGPSSCAHSHPADQGVERRGGPGTPRLGPHSTQPASLRLGGGDFKDLCPFVFLFSFLSSTVQ